MPTFQEAVNGALRGGLCAVLGANETAAKLLTSVSGDPLGVVPLASGLRRQLCSDDPANDPVPPDPPEAGQCPAVYLVTFSPIRGSGATDTPFSRPVRGPIGAVRFLEPDNQWQIFCTAISANTTQCAVLGDEGPAWRSVGLSGSAYIGGSLGVNIGARCDGQPDDCGGDPPPPVDPEPVPGPPTDITYNIDGDTNITVPLTAVYAPVFVDLDGSVRVPVTVNVDGIEFNGTVKISPEFEVEIKPTINIGGPGSPDDPDVIGQPGGGAEPIDDVDELESTIVGVLVYSDIDSEARPSGIEFTNGPDIYAPRLASVQFAIKTKNSIGWTSDLDVKNLECYVPCPAPQGAIAVRVSPMPGVQSRFTAVRAQPLTSF